VGTAILAITVCEAECALLGVTLGILGVTAVFGLAAGAAWAPFTVPAVLVLGALASPTDPSATLAVSHQYKAKGPVATTIMGVAAFDDMLGIINFSVAVSVAGTILSQKPFSFSGSVGGPVIVIVGGIATGIIFGLILNQLTQYICRETEGALIVLIIAILCLCFGLARRLEVDELLAAMTAGAVVVNFNRQSERVFKILERYTEEMIFVLFFTLSGMQLDVSTLGGVLPFILLFVALRALGKMGGTAAGAYLAGASSHVRRYAAFGLIPQGGIVVGLALMVKSNPDLEPIGDIVMSIVIGATVIHELVGPLVAKFALTRAGEIRG
jgi:Kef-type K+ transport system membrane component KefB